MHDLPMMDSSGHDQRRLREACGVTFNALSARWDETCDGDVTERAQILEELRHVTRIWTESITTEDQTPQ